MIETIDCIIRRGRNSCLQGCKEMKSNMLRQTKDNIIYYNFPCRYRQKVGFTGHWELAMLKRRREIFENGGARKERETRK